MTRPSEICVFLVDYPLATRVPVFDIVCFARAWTTNSNGPLVVRRLGAGTYLVTMPLPPRCGKGLHGQTAMPVLD